jgi:hypothetical protein
MSVQDCADTFVLAMPVGQAGAGSFDVPDWDPVSQRQVRDALVALFATLPDSKGSSAPDGSWTFPEARPG